MSRSRSRSHSHSNTNSSSHGSPLAAAGGSIRAGEEDQKRNPPPAGWSVGGSAARAGGSGNASVGDASTGSRSNRDGSKLGDLEILARREKIYSMSQSRSGCRVRETSTTLVAMASEMRTGRRQRRGYRWGRIQRDATLPGPRPKQLQQRL